MLRDSQYDWEIVREGRFARVHSEIRSRTYRRLIDDFARRVSGRHSHCSVYLRGSLFEHAEPGLVFDADILIVGSSVDARDIHSLWNRLCRKHFCGLRLDVSILTHKEFFHDRNLLVRSMVQAKGILLAGNDLFAGRKPRKVLGANAGMMTRNYIRSTEEYFGGNTDRISCASIQKRVLRLGGLYALNRFRRFSRNPGRCAEFIAEQRPDLKEKAREVMNDLFMRRENPPARYRAMQLWLLLRRNAAVRDIFR